MDYSHAYKEIGKIIQRRRKQFGLTQEVLAPRVMMSRASLANIERGNQRLLVHQLYIIANALEIDPKDLLPSMQKDSKKIADAANFNWSNSDLSKEQQSQLMDIIGDDFELD